ncbi:MAG: heavy metal translocating P-type ATPase [Patescibacteria group bacterium]
MKTIKFTITNLICCGEDEVIVGKLKSNPHIVDASMNLANGIVIVSFNEKKITPEKIKKIVADLGFTCSVSSPLLQGRPSKAAKDKPARKMSHEEMGHSKKEMEKMDHEEMMTDPTMAKTMEGDMKRRFYISLVLSIPIIFLSPFGVQILNIDWSFLPIHPNWILLPLTSLVVFWVGNIFPIGAYRALKNKTLNMMVLISTGVLAAYLFSLVIMVFVGIDAETFFEAAAMLVTFVLFGHWMEMKSRRGTSDALRALFNLVPPKARVIRGGKEVEIPTSEVKIGDIIILKPGDKIPVDGEVVQGETSIDESLVTGESMPVTKNVGDSVVGGSINQSGSVEFKATKVGEDTALAQIVKMVAAAQNSKAPGQRLADKAAQYLVILAVGSGIITFGVWFLLLGEPLLFALTFAISAVVIACPDALGLATPTAVAVGTGLGAKHNILIKDAATLEQVSKVEAVVLDKTGTLTEGKPKITDVVAAEGFSEDEIIRLDAAAEAKSGHPLSLAVMDEAGRRKLKIPTKVSGFENLSGHGVKAMVEGRQVLVGTARLMEMNKVDITPIKKGLEKLLNEGKTLMILAIDGRVAGIAAASDPIKESAALAIEKLQKLEIEVAMITGDNKKTAESVAKKLKIKRVFAEVLPEDKAKYVKKLQSEGKFTAMVGDGVNDAPALAQADVGIAIGAGTDVAIETANVVLMKSDPVDILRAIRLSKATVAKMKQNLAWASVYNISAIPIAAGVLYPSFGITLRPEISALLMSASSIIVATNAILLKRVEKSLVEAV